MNGGSSVNNIQYTLKNSKRVVVEYKLIKICVWSKTYPSNPQMIFLCFHISTMLNSLLILIFKRIVIYEV